MSSVRHRISTLLRRSSLVGDKDKNAAADSGSERDPNSRSGSPSPSLRRGSGEGNGSKRRKRVSFSSFRGRSGTADGVEHSQLAKEVVNAINNDNKPAAEPSSSSDEPVVAVVALPAEASIEPAKTESSLEAASLQDSNDHHPIVPVAYDEQRAAAGEEEEVVEPVTQIIVTEAHPEVPAVEETKTENFEASEELNEVQVSSTMIMRDSPSHSMVNIAVIEPAPAFPEPATYDTSFTSSSSNAGPSNHLAPISMPVPRPFGGQPLSAIDELRAKGHPAAATGVTDWTQKDDVNYDADADEEESKPLLESSILTGPDLSMQRPLGDSILSLKTGPSDLKGKGPDTTTTALYEALGWTEYILPNAAHYFALHVSSPASPQHLKMPTPITASPTVTVVADYDLRDNSLLKRVCDEMRTLIKTELPTLASSPWAGDNFGGGGWELWLHRPSNYEGQKDVTRAMIVHTWINHPRRMVSPRPLGAATSDVPSDGEGEEKKKEKLSNELAYWSFVEKHPSHGLLAPDARREALEGLTWSYADRLLEDNAAVPPPFSQEECQSLLRLIENYNGSTFVPDRAISNRIIASVLSRIARHKLAAIEVAETDKLDDGEPRNALDRKGRSPEIANFPYRRAILGFLSAIVCWGIPYIFLDHASSSAGSDPLERFKPLRGHAVDSNGMQMYYALESAEVTAERRHNAMIYGAGVGVTAAVMVGAATTVLTMRPSLTTPARTAAFVSLLCASASLAASLISLARMSRLSHDNNNNFPWASYSRSSEFFPGARRDAESLMVLNVRASFSPPSTSLDINPPRNRFGIPFPWFS